MPKRRYINTQHYLTQIYAQQRIIADQISELIARYELLEDRADVLIAYDWQSRHHFPLVADLSIKEGLSAPTRA